MAQKLIAKELPILVFKVGQLMFVKNACVLPTACAWVFPYGAAFNVATTAGKAPVGVFDDLVQWEDDPSGLKGLFVGDVHWLLGC